ncbi:hypothetical protein [Holospora curviuscula]|uniref:Uncharacterized protein n=1 Tax=Holospora curviuscula TaxID=1082868 RepID=A0A2S5R6S4_9PROT|nr:hypothetical protein [Holospora curviuscula]PPE03014.1 hypothetical protein HCUR_01547 [Holospora curviuscula]
MKRNVKKNFNYVYCLVMIGSGAFSVPELIRVKEVIEELQKITEQLSECFSEYQNFSDQIDSLEVETIKAEQSLRHFQCNPTDSRGFPDFFQGLEELDQEYQDKAQDLALISEIHNILFKRRTKLQNQDCSEFLDYLAQNQDSVDDLLKIQEQNMRNMLEKSRKVGQDILNQYKKVFEKISSRTSSLKYIRLYANIVPEAQTEVQHHVSSVKKGFLKALQNNINSWITNLGPRLCLAQKTERLLQEILSENGEPIVIENIDKHLKRIADAYFDNQTIITVQKLLSDIPQLSLFTVPKEEHIFPLKREQIEQKIFPLKQKQIEQKSMLTVHTLLQNIQQGLQAQQTAKQQTIEHHLRILVSPGAAQQLDWSTQKIVMEYLQKILQDINQKNENFQDTQYKREHFITAQHLITQAKDKFASSHKKFLDEPSKSLNVIPVSVLSQSMLLAQSCLQRIQDELQAQQEDRLLAQQCPDLTAECRLKLTAQQIGNIIAQRSIFDAHKDLLRKRYMQQVPEQWVKQKDRSNLIAWQLGNTVTQSWIIDIQKEVLLYLEKVQKILVKDNSEIPQLILPLILRQQSLKYHYRLLSAFVREDFFPCFRKNNVGTGQPVEESVEILKNLTRTYNTPMFRRGLEEKIRQALHKNGFEPQDIEKIIQSGFQSKDLNNSNGQKYNLQSKQEKN